MQPTTSCVFSVPMTEREQVAALLRRLRAERPHLYAAAITALRAISDRLKLKNSEHRC